MQLIHKHTHRLTEGRGAGGCQRTHKRVIFTEGELPKYLSLSQLLCREVEENTEVLVTRLNKTGLKHRSPAVLI